MNSQNNKKFWFLEKNPNATPNHLKFVIDYGKKQAQCKGFNTCPDDNKTIEKASLRVSLNESFGTHEETGCFPCLGYYHYSPCFIKSCKWRNALPITKKNLKAKEFLKEERFGNDFKRISPID